VHLFCACSRAPYCSTGYNIFILFIVLCLDSAWRSFENKPYTDKVLSLHWLKGEHDNFFDLFSCGPEGLVIWWTVQCLKTSQSFSCEVKANFRLPYCRQRWPNSVYLVTRDTICTERNASLVLCGDRRGSLHVFKNIAENEVRNVAGRMGGNVQLVCHGARDASSLTLWLVHYCNHGL
jgi:hypothetical protein